MSDWTYTTEPADPAQIKELNRFLALDAPDGFAIGDEPHDACGCERCQAALLAASSSATREDTT